MRIHAQRVVYAVQIDKNAANLWFVIFGYTNKIDLTSRKYTNRPGYVYCSYPSKQSKTNCACLESWKSQKPLRVTSVKEQHLQTPDGTLRSLCASKILLIAPLVVIWIF